MFKSSFIKIIWESESSTKSLTTTTGHSRHDFVFLVCCGFGYTSFSKSVVPHFITKWQSTLSFSIYNTLLFIEQEFVKYDWKNKIHRFKKFSSNIKNIQSILKTSTFSYPSHKIGIWYLQFLVANYNSETMCSQSCKKTSLTFPV